MLHVDLHVHTIFSGDSLTPPEHVLRWAARRHLGALAITDHNTMAGALALRRIAPTLIIVGEEIRTTRGELIGLFLQEEIPPDLTPAETVRAIHLQGGVVYVPHPFDRVRHSALASDALQEIIADVDVIEVLNARVIYALDNQRAAELATTHRLRRGAGSDAHQGIELGCAYVEMPAFADAPSFLASLAQGRIVGQISSPLVHVSSAYARLAKGLLAAGWSR